MRDPDEGVSADGTIRTGVSRDRMPSVFEPVLDALADALVRRPAVSWYVYGSVATGQARPGLSDVDVVTVGLPTADAAAIGNDLSVRFADRCRGVEIAPAQAAGLLGGGDEAYGNRVFLRHYCLHLGGPPATAETPAYPADAAAARGFNGDIGDHLRRWRAAASQTDAAVPLGRRVARKTLLAAAGLVSVLDSTWTTDRSLAAARYAELHPELAVDLSILLGWATDAELASAARLGSALEGGGVVDRLVAEFGATVGFWSRS